MKREPVLLLTYLLLLIIPGPVLFAKQVNSKAFPSFTIGKTIVIPGVTSVGRNDKVIPDVITIPLKRVGQLFLIEATIDNETGNFLFDTGSQELVLNSIYFRKYITGNDVEGEGVTGSVNGVTRTWIQDFDVAGILYRNIPADIADLGHLENRRGVKIFGLFGFSLLNDMEVVIDASHNQLMLYKLDRSGFRLCEKDKQFHGDISQHGELHNNILFLRASIGGKLLDFCFDTGAESNVINSSLPRKVMDKVTIIRRAALNGMGTDKTDVLYGKLNDFKIGEKQITGMQVLVTRLESMSVSFEHSLDGILGFDFLVQGIISVNLVTKEVRITFAKGGNP